MPTTLAEKACRHLARPIGPFLTWLLSRSAHRAAFKAAARIGLPTYVIFSTVALGMAVERLSLTTLWLSGLLILGLAWGAPLLFAKWIVLDRGNPTAVLELDWTRGKLIAHMGRDLANHARIRHAIKDTLALARELGIREIVMRSAVFGEPKDLPAWMDYLEDVARLYYEDAEVEWLDDKPLSRCETQHYLGLYPDAARHMRFLDDRLAASRIRIKL